MDNLTSLIIVFEDQGRLMLPAKTTQKATEKESAKSKKQYFSNENWSILNRQDKPEQELLKSN